MPRHHPQAQAQPQPQSTTSNRRQQFLLDITKQKHAAKHNIGREVNKFVDDTFTLILDELCAIIDGDEPITPQSLAQLKQQIRKATADGQKKIFATVNSGKWSLLSVLLLWQG